MTCLKVLEIGAQVASVITAIVAVFAYVAYRLSLYRRVRAMEKILANKNQPADYSLSLAQLSSQPLAA
jgi:hypothetical protein